MHGHAVAMENVRIGVADSTEKMRIGEGALESVILRTKAGLECVKGCGERIEAACVHGAQGSSPRITCREARRSRPASVSSREPAEKSNAASVLRFVRAAPSFRQCSLPEVWLSARRVPRSEPSNPPRRQIPNPLPENAPGTEI